MTTYTIRANGKLVVIDSVAEKAKWDAAIARLLANRR